MRCVGNPVLLARSLDFQANELRFHFYLELLKFFFWDKCPVKWWVHRWVGGGVLMLSPMWELLSCWRTGEKWQVMVKGREEVCKMNTEEREKSKNFSGSQFDLRYHCSCCRNHWGERYFGGKRMKAALTSLYLRYFGTLRSKCWLGSRNIGELCLGEVGRSCCCQGQKYIKEKGVSK